MPQIVWFSLFGRSGNIIKEVDGDLSMELEAIPLRKEVVMIISMVE